MDVTGQHFHSFFGFKSGLTAAVLLEGVQFADVEMAAVFQVVFHLLKYRAEFFDMFQDQGTGDKVCFPVGKGPGLRYVGYLENNVFITDLLPRPGHHLF